MSNDMKEVAETESVRMIPCGATAVKNGAKLSEMVTSGLKELSKTLSGPWYYGFNSLLLYVTNKL